MERTRPVYAGVVHDMMTVREVSNVHMAGRPTAENSWFKGYAWTVVFCGCGEHLGWRFTAINPRLRPENFYGIRRSAIEWN